MNSNQKKIIDYYRSLESRIGYTLFTWNAKHFGYYPSPNSSITEQKAQDLMEDLLAKKLQIKSGDFILDAGCGRGIVSSYLAKKYGAKIIGIDLVDFELKMANKKAQNLKLTDKLKYFRRDYSNTKFPNSYFDKVYTMETLVHSPNINKTLKEFLRILKPGGRLVLFEYTISDRNNFTDYEYFVLSFIASGSAMLGLSKMLHNYTADLIKKVSFNLLNVEDITKHVIPSLFRFHELAKYSYPIIKLLHLQKFFVNTVAGVEFYNLVKKGLVKYRIFTAVKPKVKMT